MPALFAPGLAQLIPGALGSALPRAAAAASSLPSRRGLSVLTAPTARPQRQDAQQQQQQQRRGLASIGYPDAEDAADRGAGGTLRPTTPWVRQVISGVDLMRHPKYNKGLAFSEAERDRLYLRGLLPPAVLSQEVQLERAILNIRSKEDLLDRYSYLQSLQGRNERLFYRVLLEHFEELLPIISNPTVRQACQRYGLMFKSLPRGLFVTLEDRGGVFRILKNWPERNVRVVCVTDGEHVGSLGDLGVQAIGTSMSKLSLHTACGGVQPATTMPVVIDVGTDNEELLRSPLYVGVRHRRVRGDAYYQLMDEFLTAVRRRYGNTTLIHFEDLGHENGAKLLNMYRTDFPCYNDDLQGLGTAVLAAVLGALPKTGGSLADHTVVLAGDGATTSCIAELLAAAVAQQTGATVLEARQNMWLVDSSGLVTRGRGDSSTLDDYKLPYCHSGPEAHCPDLLSAVRQLKPTVLIGCTQTGSPPFKFDQPVVNAMLANARHPVIFPLSPAEAECTAADAYAWSQGRAVVAVEAPIWTPGSGGPAFPANEWGLTPSQITSTYIFPGVALGTMISRCTRLRDEQFIAAAEAVARLVTEEERAAGLSLPPLHQIREVSAHVARAVAQKAYEGGFATDMPKPHSLLDRARSYMYSPLYRTLR
ncbi:NADP-dependent malic enzyme [Raphidocelis subcapitata]|uniref:NADP-dependent malic enzyme n=1 Tax=Raphidocelis subcapitata TaxID=307507 RepID=A0A2V0PN17_9CHLO|nr:NADP-dependent malic enzyme [Raphidocelis subcapitata]|eukprot:GBF99300.1 NADP-dependent malic enzyme [Raphidocelis subcapitata]